MIIISCFILTFAVNYHGWVGGIEKEAYTFI